MSREADMTQTDKIYKAGDKCPECGQVMGKVVQTASEGCKRTKEERTILACRCLHPGDYSCTCGDPCWSFF